MNTICYDIGYGSYGILLISQVYRKKKRETRAITRGYSTQHVSKYAVTAVAIFKPLIAIAFYRLRQAAGDVTIAVTCEVGPGVRGGRRVQGKRAGPEVSGIGPFVQPWASGEVLGHQETGFLWR